MSAKVRFCRDPVESVCRPLQLSELRLLHLLEDHMQDVPKCFRHLRHFRLTRMCPNCRGLASYTILRFQALGGRFVRRLEYECTTTFVEIPRSFGNTRFILRSLTEDDVELLSAGERSMSEGTQRTSIPQAAPLSHKPRDKDIRTSYFITYHRSTEHHDPARYETEISCRREEDVEISFRRLVLTSTRNK